MTSLNPDPHPPPRCGLRKKGFTRQWGGMVEIYVAARVLRSRTAASIWAMLDAMPLVALFDTDLKCVFSGSI